MSFTGSGKTAVEDGNNSWRTLAGKNLTVRKSGSFFDDDFTTCSQGHDWNVF